MGKRTQKLVNIVQVPSKLITPRKVDQKYHENNIKLKVNLK